MQGYGRLVRIPVGRQRAHQSGQILARDPPLQHRGANGRRDPVHCRRHRRAALHHHGRPCAHSVAALGFSITTERLHDRDKSAWWLVVFYLVPGVLGQFAKAAWVAWAAGTALHYILRLRALRSRSGDLSKSAACAAPPAPTDTGRTRFCSLNGGAEWQGAKNEKSPAAVRPPGEFCMLGNMSPADTSHGKVQMFIIAAPPSSIAVPATWLRLCRAVPRH